MKNKRSVLKIIAVITPLIFVSFFFSNNVYGCDDCGSVGHTWCSGGTLWECRQCGLSCPPGVNAHCWQQSGPSCDTSCTSAMHKYSWNTGNSCCTTSSPDTPSLVSPANGATIGNPTTFSWNAISGWGNQCGDGTANDGYDIRIGSTNQPWNSTVASAFINASGTESWTWNGSGATPGNTYYWAVRADNGPEESGWSAVRSFVYNRAPTCVDLTGPATVDEGELVYYNMIGNDPDHDNMAWVWGGDTTCGDGGFETVNNITVSARMVKTPPSLAVDMLMRITAWDDAQNRYDGPNAPLTGCYFTVSNTSWQTFSCDIVGGMKLSQLGVQSLYDHWNPPESADLHIQWVEIDGRRITPAVQDVNGFYNSMDPSGGSQGPAYDGYNLNITQGMGALDCTVGSCNTRTLTCGDDSPCTGGEWHYWWAGAVKMGLPWRAPTDGTRNCTLTVTPRDVWGASGNTCTQNIEVQYYRPVTGEIRDITGNLACSAGSPLVDADVDDGTPINVTVADSPGSFSDTVTWDDSNGTYTVNGVPVFDPAAKSISTNSFIPEGLANFTYQLGCIEAGPGTNEFITPGTNTGGFDMEYTSNPTDANVVNLGYFLNSTGWFTAMDGDVYAGQNTGFSISTGIPDAADVAPGWSGNLIENAGFVFGNAGLSIQDPSGNDRFSERGGGLEDVAATGTWPISYEFTAPPHALTISSAAQCSGGAGFQNMDPQEVYTASAGCVNAAIANNANYSVAGGGIAVVYVTDDGDDLVVDTGYTSTNAGRILYVSEVPVVFGSALTTGDVGPGAAATVQAGFISEDSITFESDGASTDTTLVVEGPLVVGGPGSSSIEFNRDRGFSNNYPATHVKYNLDYLVKLTEQERQYSPPVNYTGLSIIDVVIGNTQ